LAADYAPSAFGGSALIRPTSVLGGFNAMQTFGKLKLYYGLFGSPILLLVMFVLFVRQQRHLPAA
jgi:hypothetical protein